MVVQSGVVGPTSSAPPAVEVQGLEKHFGAVTAVAGVSFAMAPLGVV
jgi:ABC-type branched-subunit amino acid transport system ATPase component